MQQFATNEYRTIADTLGSLGSVLSEQHKLVEAEATFRQQLEVLQQFCTNQHERIAHAFYKLGGALWEQRKWPEAEASFRKELAIRQHFGTNDERKIAVVLHNLASALEHQGNFGQAATFYRQALDMGDKLHEPSTGDALASLLKKRGKLAELESLYRDRVDIFRNPRTADSKLKKALTSLARFLREEKRDAEAEPYEREATELARKAQPTTSK
jgi:tetratricopeptide (TPR) repeat protein